MSEFVFITAALGLLFILQYSYILKIPRDFLKAKIPFFKKLIECSMCSGFWVGIAMGFFYLEPFTLFGILCCGFSISFLGSLFNFIMEYLDDKIFENKVKIKENGKTEDKNG